MKTHILIIALIYTSFGNLFSQNIKYTILEDNPEKAYANFIVIEPLGIDFDFDFSSAAVYVGVNGRWGITDKLAVEGLVRPTVFHISGEGFGIQSEVGVFFSLIEKTKTKDLPVVLSYDMNAGETSSGDRIEETKYIKVPGKLQSSLGARGGFYQKKTGYEPGGANTISSSMALVGAYVGFQKTLQAYVKTMINGKLERIGGSFTKMYADFLILPARSITDATLAASAEKDRGWGWRAGFQWYLDSHDGEYKRLGKTVISAEIGSLPYMGWYINMSYGWAIISR